MEVTIGGNRVGSGQKMKAHLHNYYRSTHNLSEKWASSMASGVLYPALCKLAMRGDSFDISIAADARTIPTQTPLFGSFKMQVDVYQVPVRLYQGILHNNPLAIGLKMNQVKFPMLKVGSKTEKDGETNAKMNESSLLKYLGFSGIGKSNTTLAKSTLYREINAIPALAYYDIVKTYYANKQEDNAYVISVEEIEGEEVGTKGTTFTQKLNGSYSTLNFDTTYNANYPAYQAGAEITIPLKNGLDLLNSSSNTNDLVYLQHYIVMDQATDDTNYSLSQLYEAGEQGLIFGATKIQLLELNNDEVKIKLQVDTNNALYNQQKFQIVSFEEETNTKKTAAITPFPLSNIDDMRYDLLSHNTLGTTFVIQNDENAYLPYSTLVAQTTTNGEAISYNCYPMNGLCLKTYQNDIFNNWLNSDWIEGENGINELSKVSIVDGAFSMDALSFAEKLYNMLNRIAVAGATYEDWQDTVYETVKRRQIESPIFCGGMSQEIMFDEIVQTAPGDGDPDGTGTLGTLGGRGRLATKPKGGKIHIKCDEACFIIAIVSLTPRVFYTQGNEFYMTDIKTMDDLHKPAMDGIGFQDLIGERMAWWDTTINATDHETIVHRSKIGKLPAWIEYMTSFDKAYGDFALEYGKSSLTLNRNYEHDESTRGIKDATTYVDPSKYNYAFAYKALDAQNFWVMINFDIKARRLMSARLIPNV